MKKAEIIKNGNLNLENITIKHKSEMFPSIKIVNHLDFTIKFFQWFENNVHQIPTSKFFRLKSDENFLIKRDLENVIEYFKKNVYGN